MRHAPHPVDTAAPTDSSQRKEAIESVYRAVAEALLPPEQRDRTIVARACAECGSLLPDASAELQAFFVRPEAWSEGEYISTLELAPPCPLYLGAYMFDEPTTCRGAGLSGRNGYMMELARIYEHYGLRSGGRELSDFLPMAAEFLALSLCDAHERNDRGLRRRLLEHMILPALGPMIERLREYECAYASVVEALRLAILAELDLLSDVAAWQPPVSQPMPGGCRLHVLDPSEQRRPDEAGQGGAHTPAPAATCKGGMQ